MTEPISNPPGRRSLPSLLCASLGAVLLSGCASSNYLTDRWNDAKDICTATVGVGGGAKARVGFFGTGLHAVRDYAGLRGGDFGALDPKANQTLDVSLVLIGMETSPATEGMHSRAKDYMTWQWLFFQTPAMMDDDHHPKAHFYTQVEVVAGAGGSVRLGFNPGELVDFLFGWFGADLFGDDQARLRPKAESEPAKEDPKPGAK